MEFICTNLQATYASDRIWTGNIELEEYSDPLFEFRISGKGSELYTLIGKFSYGYYLCIPQWGIGCPICSLSDSFWNLEQLQRWLPKVDAITISEGLKAYATKYGDMA